MLREDRRHDRQRRPAHDACRARPRAAAHGFGCSVKCRDAAAIKLQDWRDTFAAVKSTSA